MLRKKVDKYLDETIFLTMDLFYLFIITFSMILFWILGKINKDEVIGLLEKILSVTLAFILLFVGHNIFFEFIVLTLALKLPTTSDNDSKFVD